MQTKPAYGVVAIAILHISTHRMPHIGGMNAYLVFPTGLKTELHERIIGLRFQCVEMCHGIFPTVISG